MLLACSDGGCPSFFCLFLLLLLIFLFFSLFPTFSGQSHGAYLLSLLFTLSETKRCQYLLLALFSAYCSIIILGLLLSTCSFYHYAPPLSGLFPTQSLQAERAVPIDLPVTTTTTTSIPVPSSDSKTIDAIIETSSFTEQQQQQQQQPSSCWIDLTHSNHGRMSKMDLGRWSAHIWRRYPSVLSQIGRDDNSTSIDTSSWKQFLTNGIFIGINNIGFRLKFMLE